MTGIAYARDYEVVQRLRPEPMTEAEAAAQAHIDPVEFDIFKHKMHMIALEGKETTMKLGASTAMRSSGSGNAAGPSSAPPPSRRAATASSSSAV